MSIGFETMEEKVSRNGQRVKKSDQIGQDYGNHFLLDLTPRHHLLELQPAKIISTHF